MIAAAIMRQAEQRIFRCDRFRRNGVQSGSGDLAAAQGFGKGGAGHKVAAGSVDDECAVLHARQKTCVHHVHGLRCDRQMQAEDIAAFLYRFKSCIFRMAGFLGGAVGPERVIIQHLRPKGGQHLRHGAGNGTKAHQTNGAVAQFPDAARGDAVLLLLVLPALGYQCIRP
jgi:hypothetical protein